VKRLHPTGGARFTEMKCDVTKQGVVACAGYLSYADAPGGAVRVQQYFRIREPHNGSARLVPYCPPTSGRSSGTMPRIFCAQ
jgi:hypothetical protein